MAITTVPLFTFPGAHPCGATPVLTNGTMNASGDKMAFIFQCPKAGILDKSVFNIFLVSNNPDNGIRVSFQDVDSATGLPDGVQDQYRDLTGTITSGWKTTGLMTSDGTDTGTKRTVTRGQWLALCFEFVSFVASDSIAISWNTLGAQVSHKSGTYVADGSTGTYSKSTDGIPTMGLIYNDATYGIFPLGPYPAAFVSNTYGSGSNPDEYALRFKVPFKCRMSGIYHVTDPDAACDIVLYDSGGSVLDTISILFNVRGNTGPGHFYQLWPNGSITLDANTLYRISVKPGASNVTQWSWAFGASADLAGMPAGVEWYQSTRVDGGSWTDDQTKVPFLSLLLDGIEFTSAGGSGGSHAYIK